MKKSHRYESGFRKELELNHCASVRVKAACFLCEALPYPPVARIVSLAKIDAMSPFTCLRWSNQYVSYHPW